MTKTGVSFVIATFNASRTLGQCLGSIAFQAYPKSKLEVLIVDGGSTDATLTIAKSFKNQIKLRIIDAGWPDNMEARRYFGFVKAKQPFICILDSDNYLGDDQVLTRLIQPLLESDEIVGSFSLHYQYVPTFGLLNKYISLFGQHDPVAYYLNKADRKKLTDTSWPVKSQIVAANQRWTVVQFNPADFPTLGSNGFVVRKGLVQLKALRPEIFFHTDILYDLLNQGRNQYAVVDVPIAHESSARILRHLSRRFEYMTLHTLNLADQRRYLVFNPTFFWDVFNLAKFAVLTITLVEPMWQAITGYIKKPDRAWFLHPVLCWGFLITYTLALVSKGLKLNHA